MRDLHGVPAAKTRRVRAHLAFEPLELPALATWTVGRFEEFGDLQSPERVLPHVHYQQFAIDRLAVAGENLERLGRLETGNDIDNGSQDSRGLACRRHSWRRA